MRNEAAKENTSAETFFLKRRQYLCRPGAPKLPIVSRDFTTERCCAFCSTELKTGIAMILDDPKFRAVASGPECAKKYGIRSRNYVDFTSGMEESPVRKWPETPNSRAARAKLQYSPEEEVRRYLSLRYKKLGQAWFGRYVRNEALETIFAKIKDGTVDASDYASAAEMMRGRYIAEGMVSPAHLMRCYQAKRLIEQCLDRGDHNAGRLRETAAMLRRNLSLPAARVRFINEEAQLRSPHLPVLREDAFAASEAMRISEILSRPLTAPLPANPEDYGEIRVVRRRNPSALGPYNS